jgi:hypothetical protein
MIYTRTRSSSISVRTRSKKSVRTRSKNFVKTKDITKKQRKVVVAVEDLPPDESDLVSLPPDDSDLVSEDSVLPLNIWLDAIYEDE